MKPTTAEPCCPNCRGKRITDGQLHGGRDSVTLRLEDARVQLLVLIEQVHPMNIGDRVQVCVDCGMMWGILDPSRLRDVVDRFGSKALKRRLLGDGTIEAVPAPTPAGRGDEPAPTD